MKLWLVRINDQPKIVEVLVAEEVGCDVPDAIDILAESIEDLLFGYLCRVLPGQYRSTAGSTAKKLILHSGCLSCFLYMTELDLLTV